MIHAVIDTNVLVSAFITKRLDSATAIVWAAVLYCGNTVRNAGDFESREQMKKNNS